MSNKPKIRFKGFDEDWEQRKLIEVCDYVDYRGKTPTKTDFGIFLVTAKNVKNGYIDYESSKEYISEDDYEEVMHRGKPQLGDVLITTEAPCGNVAQVNNENIALAQRIIKYRGHNNVVDNTYLKHYMLSSAFQKILSEKSSGGTVQGIKGSTLHQQVICYPVFEEQIKLGQYLDYLDHLITLHQRKCEQTKTLKKYMLQKMFPQEGTNVPEIRFSGFTDAWEQRKFGDLTTRESKCDISSADLPSVEYEDVIAEEGLLNKDISLKGVQKKGIVFDGSQVLYGKLRPYLHNWLNPDFMGVAVGDWWVLQPVEMNKNFIYRLIQTKQFDDVANQSAGSKMPRADWNLVSETEFMVPCSSEEQVKIGDYFSSLDHLITLHQRKSDDLKELKRFMLQNMFPSNEN
jgi:type I restriction enzyme S subunit